MCQNGGCINSGTNGYIIIAKFTRYDIVNITSPLIPKYGFSGYLIGLSDYS